VRVVSLTCSNTEIVCALGLGQLLVGIDDHSDFPHDVVSRLPRLGPDLEIDVEAVAALRPDLVLASLTVPGHERVLEALSRARLPFIAPEPISVSDIYSDILCIGSRLGVSARAAALVSDMQRELAAPPPERTRIPSILVEWWPKPVIVPGRDSWVNQLLAAAGGKNPLASRPVKSEPVNDELVRELDPDAVVISWCGIKLEKYRPEIVYRRAGWQNVRALEQRRVYAIPEAHLGRPGPRVIEGYRAFCRIVAECAED